MAMFKRRSRDSDLDDEIRTHIDLLAAEHERRGLSPTEARYAARRAFGAVEAMKESYRDRQRLRSMEAFGQSLTKKFGPPRPRPGAPPSLFALESATNLFNEIQSSDAAPTAAVKAAVTDIQTKVGPMMDDWKQLIEVDLPALNQELKTAGFAEIKPAG